MTLKRIMPKLKGLLPYLSVGKPPLVWGKWLSCYFFIFKKNKPIAEKLAVVSM